MKKYLFIVIIGILALTSTAVYADNDFVAESGFEFTVNGKTFGGVGTIDELVVYDTYFTVEVSSGSSFTVTSDDGYTFDFASRATINTDCPGGVSKLIINGDGDHTFTFTPQSDTCVASGGGGGGGGGGGSTYIPPTVVDDSEDDTTDDTTDDSDDDTTNDTTDDSGQAGDTSDSSTGQSADSGETSLEQMTNEASTVASGDVNGLVQSRNQERNLEREQEYNGSIVARVVANAGQVSEQARTQLVNFVTYGTSSTDRLGAGERAGVVNSYLSAFGKLPSTAEEWNDVVKIANGRWPTERSTVKEDRAKVSFRTIYLREPNMDNANDNAAVTVMAYGLRPANRNLNSEAVAINHFRNIFGYTPTAATHWDAVRAIAYSGASR